MQAKQKLCAGVEGVTSPHFAYIYKNIGRNKYCKECAYRINPPKPIPKRTQKQNELIKERTSLTEEQFAFFLEVWRERQDSDGRNFCEVSGRKLPLEPLSLYFDHLLEKSSHPEYRFDKRNIAIVHQDVHTLKTNGFPLPKHKELIDNFKKLINE